MVSSVGLASDDLTYVEAYSSRLNQGRGNAND